MIIERHHIPNGTTGEKIVPTKVKKYANEEEKQERQSIPTQKPIHQHQVPPPHKAQPANPTPMNQNPNLSLPHPKSEQEMVEEDDNILYCNCKQPSGGPMVACDDPEVI